MASTYEELARLPQASAVPRTRSSFAFGKPARRRESIARAFVPFVELQRREQREVCPALLQTLSKLLVWIVAGVAATSAATCVLGAVIVRIWSGAFG